MKLLKSHWKVFFCATIGVMLLGSPVYWHYTLQILEAFKVSWLFLGIVIAIIATPLGNHRLSPALDEPPRYRGLTWWGMIVLFEVCLSGLFWGICELNGTLLPILTTEKKALFVEHFHTSLYHLGLFPWPLYALLAVGFAHTAYKQQRNAYTCSLMSPFVKLSPNQIWGMVFDTGARLVTLCVIFTTLVFVTLLLTNALAHETLTNIIGLRASALMAVFILAFLLINKRLKNYLHMIIIKQNISPCFTLYLFVLAASFTLIVLGTLLSGMSHNLVSMPGVIQGLVSKGWHVNWSIFSNLWWWGWSPIMGLFLARLSRGHTVRATLVAILALPLLVSAIGYLGLHYHFSISLVTHSPILAAVITITAFVIFTVLIMPKSTFGMLSDLYLPKNDNVKHRAEDKLMHRWLSGTAITYYLYLPAGITTLGLFFFLSSVCFCISTLLLTLALLKGLRQH